MIQLGQPWALLALLSIPVILALHSLRPSRRTVRVSSNVLWREALREQRRGFGLEKLLRNLSLMLLLLFALLASLSLAAPQWMTRTQDHGDLVLVIDTSASMQSRVGSVTRFELAMDAAREVVDSLPGDRRMLVMSSGRHPRLRSGFESDKRVLRDVLDGITVSDEAGRPRAALTLALSLLRNRDRGRVHFLTDGAFKDRTGMLAGSVEIQEFGEPVPNVAITRFDARSEIGSEDRFQVLLAVRNYTEQAVVVPASILLDGELLAERQLQLGPSAEKIVVLAFRGGAAGRVEAAIDVDDGLGADNRVYAVMGEVQTLRVLYLGPGNLYLERALQALPNALLVRRDKIPEAALKGEFQRFDVVVVDRLPVAALPAGAYFLVDTVPPELPFGGAARVQRPVIQGSGASALMHRVDLTGVRIDEARRVGLGEDASHLQRLFWSDDSVLALAGIHEEARFVYLGFDPSDSSFPLQAAFPLFIRQSMDWLRAGEEPASPSQVPAGEVYGIQVPAGLSSVIVRSPAGDASVLAAQRGGVRYEDTSRAGIYRVTLTHPLGAVNRHFAVNLTDALESEVNRRQSRDTGSALEPVVLEGAPVGVALWPYFAVLALLALASEAILGLARRRHA